MVWLLRVLTYWLTILSADDVTVPLLAQGRAAGSVAVAYATLARPAVTEDEEPEVLADPGGGLLPPPTVVPASPADCPDGRCPPRRR